MSFGRAQAEQRGRDARRVAYANSEPDLPRIAQEFANLDVRHIRLSAIDREALVAWRENWFPHLPSELADWDWERLAGGYENDSYRFEVAIWSGGQLCGLGIGKPSNARTFLRVDVMQGCPAQHPLKGVVRYLIVDVAIQYAKALNINELRLMNPLERLWDIYGAMGFSLAGRDQKPPYCSLELSK